MNIEGTFQCRQWMNPLIVGLSLDNTCHYTSIIHIYLLDSSVIVLGCVCEVYCMYESDNMNGVWIYALNLLWLCSYMDFELLNQLMFFLCYHTIMLNLGHWLSLYIVSLPSKRLVRMSIEVWYYVNARDDRSFITSRVIVR